MTENRLEGQSFDNVRARIEELKRLFPEAVKEGRLDYDTLMTLLGDDFDNDREKYDFTWKGKQESLKLAQKRSSGTLRPDVEQSRDWETTGNLYIEGDNLEAMKLLQQGYLRKVKMIYIDPPYNTGNDFVYEDDFADPIAKYKEITGQGMRANPETAGRYHSRWLSMMYPRLKIAKTFLQDDGIICVSIDDSEAHRLKILLDEVFGEENFIANIVWQKAYVANMTAKFISNTHDHILVYARNYDLASVGKFDRTDEQKDKFQNPDDDPRGPWKAENLSAGKYYSAGQFEISGPDGSKYLPPNGRYWRCNETRFNQWREEGRIWFGKDGSSRPMLKKYLNEMESGLTPDTWWTHQHGGSNKEATIALKELFAGEAIFDTPKPVKLIGRLMELFCAQSGIVLDFFTGSGTTAHAVIQANAEDGGTRKFICIQIPEPTPEGGEARKAGYATIADIGKERIRRAGDKILAAWQEKHADRLPLGGDAATPPDVGFRVFRLDSSNWKPWDDSFVSPDEPDLFLERLKASLDNTKPGRRDIDLVYELMLKYGVELTASVAMCDIGGKRFYVVDDGLMYVCLDKDVTPETVEQLAADQSPGVVIFSDACFANNNDLTNATLSLKKAGIEYRWM